MLSINHFCRLPGKRKNEEIVRRGRDLVYYDMPSYKNSSVSASGKQGALYEKGGTIHSLKEMDSEIVLVQ